MNSKPTYSSSPEFRIAADGNGVHSNGSEQLFLGICAKFFSNRVRILGVFQIWRGNRGLTSIYQIVYYILCHVLQTWPREAQRICTSYHIRVLKYFIIFIIWRCTDYTLGRAKRGEDVNNIHISQTNLKTSYRLKHFWSTPGAFVHIRRILRKYYVFGRLYQAM